MMRRSVERFFSKYRLELLLLYNTILWGILILHLSRYFYIPVILKLFLLFVLLCMVLVPVGIFWKSIKKTVLSNMREFYVILCIVSIVGYFGAFVLDLKEAIDRVWFQGFVALSLVLIIFVEFNLDYRNRKRNILYEKQIDAFIEFHALANDIIFNRAYRYVTNDKGALIISKTYEQFLLGRIFERYDKFLYLGKDLFVKNMLERFNWEEETIDTNFSVLRSFVTYIERSSSEEAPDIIPLDTKIPIGFFHGSLKNVKFGKVRNYMINFIKNMRNIIKGELGVL